MKTCTHFLAKEHKVQRKGEVFRICEKISNVRNISKTIKNFQSSFVKPDCLVFKRNWEEIKQICSFSFNPTLFLYAQGHEKHC